MKQESFGGTLTQSIERRWISSISRRLTSFVFKYNFCYPDSCYFSSEKSNSSPTQWKSNNKNVEMPRKYLSLGRTGILEPFLKKSSHLYRQIDQPNELKKDTVVLIKDNPHMTHLGNQCCNLNSSWT